MQMADTQIGFQETWAPKQPLGWERELEMMALAVEEINR